MLAAGDHARAEAEALVAVRDGRRRSRPSTAPTSVTLSGDAATLERIARASSSERRGLRARCSRSPCRTTAAQMDAIRGELLESLASLELHDAGDPVRLDGHRRLDAGPELDAEYWWRNVRQPVHFAAALERLIDDGYTTFLELAPASGARRLRQRVPRENRAGTVLPSIRRNEDEREAMLRSLAALYAEGRDIDWRGLYGERSRHVELPRYQWQRERHWFEDAPLGGNNGWLPGEDGGHPLLRRMLAVARPIWESHARHRQPAVPRRPRRAGRADLPGRRPRRGRARRGAPAGRTSGRPSATSSSSARSSLPAEERTQLQLAVEDNRFEVHSRRRATPGRCTPGAPSARRTATPPRADLDAIRARCADGGRAGRALRRLPEGGLEYGRPSRRSRRPGADGRRGVRPRAGGRSRPRPGRVRGAPRPARRGHAPAEARPSPVRRALPAGVHRERHASTTRPGSSSGCTRGSRPTQTGDVDLLDADGRVLLTVRGHPLEGDRGRARRSRALRELALRVSPERRRCRPRPGPPAARRSSMSAPRMSCSRWRRVPMPDGRRSAGSTSTTWPAPGSARVARSFALDGLDRGRARRRGGRPSRALRPPPRTARHAPKACRRRRIQPRLLVR